MFRFLVGWSLASAFAFHLGPAWGKEAPGPSHGYFFVGGTYYDGPGGRYLAGQMYVEFLKPEHPTRPYPVVMIHGAGQSGTNFLGTPDGRPGWADIFLERGYTVFVVDQAGRGRSGYAADRFGPEARVPALEAEKRWTDCERYKLWPQASLHTQWPGDGPNRGRIGDPIFDQFYASQVPYTNNPRLTQQLNRDAGIALLERIGPAILLTHSQSGPYGWLIADARPALVKAILSVEPGGSPTADAKHPERGGAAWDWGPVSLPMAYEPAVGSASELRLIPDASPLGADLTRGRVQTEPAHVLVHLRNIPILIVTSEASEHACYDHCTVAFLRQAGADVTHLRLAEAGIRGNGHMMMLEKNNREIAEAIAGWAERHTAPSAGAAASAPAAP